MEPFYFKKYDETIGIACDVGDLKRELQRLKIENPLSAEYHLKEGHIVQWLDYINEKELASDLKNVTDIDTALAVIEKREKKVKRPAGMHPGRKGGPKKMRTNTAANRKMPS